MQSLDMGPHPLWQLEDLLPALRLRSGERVLDLGCGKGATSVFLAREFEVDVAAVDLWTSEAELRSTIELAGVAQHVDVFQADARDLPFGAHEFDAIVSIDAANGPETPLLRMLTSLEQSAIGFALVSATKLE